MVVRCDGFASWMVKDFCRHPMRVGDVIMNYEVRESTDYGVQVFRADGSVLSSGDAVSDRDWLQVRTNIPKGEYVLEVSSQAAFDGGGCKGRRIANEDDVDLEILKEENGDDHLSIVVGWALGHSQVFVSKPFLLVWKSETVSAAAESVSISETIHNSDVPILPPVKQSITSLRQRSAVMMQRQESTDDKQVTKPNESSRRHRPLRSLETNEYPLLLKVFGGLVVGMLLLFSCRLAIFRFVRTVQLLLTGQGKEDK
jgi:hypothetical protein